MTRHLLLFTATLGCTASVSEDKPDGVGTIPDTALVDSGDALRFEPVTVDPDARPPELFSQMQFFRWTGTGFDHNEGVVPYTLNTTLFSDHALKHRTIWMPAGEQIQYTAEGVFDFPVGTAITKSFLFHCSLLTFSQSVALLKKLLLSGDIFWPD